MRRVSLVDREMGAVVTGNPAMSKPDDNSSFTRLVPGAPISRSARTGVRRKRASLELQRLGVNAPSDYRQKRHAAHRLTFVPLPDIPVGVDVLEASSSYSSSAGNRDSGRGLEWVPGLFVLRTTHSRGNPVGPQRSEPERRLWVVGGTR